MERTGDRRRDVSFEGVNIGAPKVRRVYRVLGEGTVRLSTRRVCKERERSTEGVWKGYSPFSVASPRSELVSSTDRLRGSPSLEHPKLQPWRMLWNLHLLARPCA